MKEQPSIAVIGSGIIGMTTALRLSDAGYAPIVVSKDEFLQTTSAAAAAFWYPYHAQPAHKVLKWAQRSLAVFRQAAGAPETGVVWREFTEYFTPDSADPWWHNVVDGFRNNGDVELPAGRRKACSYSVPVVDTSVYLQYLHKSLQSLDVQFAQAELSSIEEAFDLAQTVVNCSGIGAKQLARDDDLHPARGQVVRIKRQPNHAALVDLTQEPKIAHVTPRINDTVLGGTYEENVYSIEPCYDEAKRIIERCKAISPALGNLTDADILGISCGLRPVRSSVRVEREQLGDKWLLHNYGHGGAGFTLSWGCAEEICQILKQCGI